MKREELTQIAAREGSEDGPLGEWEAARLATRPNAGDLIQENGEWYVAVAGRRREGYGGNLGGLYARWVKVPKEITDQWG